MGIVKAQHMLESTSRRVVSVASSIRPDRAFVSEDDMDHATHGISANTAEDQHVSQEQHRLAVDEAYRRGFNDGMDEGRIQTDDRGERAAEGLVASLARAVESVEQHIADSAELTRQLMHLVLEKLTGRLAEHPLLIGELIAEQLAQVDAKALLTLEVAEADFPEPEVLHDVLARHGLSALSIRFDKTAAAGSCRLILEREIIEAGLTTQVARARDSIDRVLGYAD